MPRPNRVEPSRAKRREKNERSEAKNDDERVGEGGGVRGGVRIPPRGHARVLEARAS